MAILNNSPCLHSIIDLRRQQFDFISSNTGAILRYDSSLLMEKGLEFCNEIIHPEDLEKTLADQKHLGFYLGSATSRPGAV